MSNLLGSPDALSCAYDVAVLDLDGVVYRGRAGVPGAREALNAAQQGGMHLAFVTNNAARPPSVVGDHLRELGLDVVDEDVVTSAQAAARLVAGLVPAGSEVYVIGGEGLELALRERGLTPVTEPGPEVAAVAQGYGPEMPWKRVVRGAMLVARGLPWVASNTDLTIPTDGGEGPGNGTLVELVGKFAGRSPQVAGKPMRPLFEETLTRVGGNRPLVIGDRLDTDIRGAHAMGWDSLLVMTGVTGLVELVAAAPDERPSYVGADLAVLGEPQPACTTDEETGVLGLGGWQARVVEDRLELTGSGGVHDWWRLAAVAGWQHLDATGAPVGVAGLQPPR